MEPQITPEYIRQLVYSILPEVLAQYQQEKGKDFYLNPLLERLIRLEEELKALRLEMNLRFEAQRKESDAKFEAINARFEGLIKEINARFEALKQESDIKFEAINARFEALTKEMNTRFEALTMEMNARFEALIKEMNTRFEAQKKESDAKFEAINARFEALDKRLNFLQWLIGIGFAFLGGLITLLNFFK